MSTRERSAIENTWLAVEVRFGVDVETVLLWGVPSGVFLALVIAVIVVWNRRLRREIALRRQVETELVRSNADLEQFAYAVSHDLRQPLRTINSFITLIDRKLGDDRGDDIRAYSDFVKDSAKRMDQMLASLLEYSRVGHGGTSMEPVETRAAVDEAVLFLTAAIKDAGAEIVLGKLWPQVVGSRDELTRLFQNLIGNAIKYRDPDRRPVVTIEASSHAEGWLFTISDNGIGIAPDQIDRLFKVFQRLHAPDTYEGTGIGLAVSRKIVERHGGRIWVESAGDGQGCRFFFTMPR